MLPSQHLACRPASRVLLLQLQMVPCQLQGGPIPFQGPLLPLLQLAALQLAAQPDPKLLPPHCCSCSPAVSHWLGPLLPGGSWKLVSRRSHLVQTKHLQQKASESRKPGLRKWVSVLCHMLANFSLILCRNRYSVTLIENQSNFEQENCKKDSALGCRNIFTRFGRSSFIFLL